MRRRVTAISAVIFLWTSVQTSASAAPFAPDDSGALKILKLVEWLGSINDLSSEPDILPTSLGFPATPKTVYYDLNGKQTKNWTEYLDRAPIWPGAQATIDYIIPEADGPAGRLRSLIRIFQLGVDTCIHLNDMISKFGKPGATYPVTDGGGFSYGWVLRQTPWKTVVSGYFGPRDEDCAEFLSIGEDR